ncbi:rel-associated pp40 [Stylonychia lemnae]|uniref:Rel-associated pp40 n=1 Tax=Stylonychia lemnae TaxID=5949 RepID=A0A077ZXB3_STYLE|nr:rel-associated pp40 [Stylonychia lemnae]|eukprot:CDW73181.1 rel-associated pp40 [Stylonychia lemnae]
MQDDEDDVKKKKKENRQYFNDPDEVSIDVSSVDIFSLARHGRFQQLKKILELGVDPNSKDKFGNTILIVGAQNGNKSIVKLALRFGGHINMTNCQDMMTLSIHSITTRAGPMQSADQTDMEPDFAQSDFETKRKEIQLIESDFDSDKMKAEIIQQAREVMEVYKTIQKDINLLDDDYNKDEDQLFNELRDIQNRNKDSIRKYKETKQTAAIVKEQLSSVLNSFD